MDATAIHTWADMERSHYVPKPVRKSRFFPVARPTVYYDSGAYFGAIGDELKAGAFNKKPRKVVAATKTIGVPNAKSSNEQFLSHEEILACINGEDVDDLIKPKDRSSKKRKFAKCEGDTEDRERKPKSGKTNSRNIINSPLIVGIDRAAAELESNTFWLS